MRLLPLKTEAELVEEHRREACTRRIPLGAIILAGYLAVCLIYAGGVKVYSAYQSANDPYVGLADGPYSF